MGKSNIDKICFSKTRFSTLSEAEAEADRIWEESQDVLHIYKCPICEGYHFTKKKTKRIR